MPMRKNKDENDHDNLTHNKTAEPAYSLSS
jgi:hypothetical protein